MESKSVGNVFLKHLPYIQTVIFSSWVYFGSVQKTTVRFSDGQAIYDTETLIPPSDSSHTPQAVMPKSEFLTRLRKIRIEHWYREYIDPTVLDGEQWQLEIRFSDGWAPLQLYGSNAYPPRFNRLRELMRIPPKNSSGPIAQFIQDHHLQTLGGRDRFQGDFSEYEWSAPIIQQPDDLTAYAHLMGLVDAKILDVDFIDSPCLPLCGWNHAWSFEWCNVLVLMTDRGNFEISYNESSSVRLSKDCIPWWFYSLDQYEDAEIDFHRLFSYLINDRIVGITTKGQTYADADKDFTGSCGIELKENLPAYLKEFRLLLESGRQLVFTSSFDDGIISLYDEKGQLIWLEPEARDGLPCG